MERRSDLQDGFQWLTTGADSFDLPPLPEDPALRQRLFEHWKNIALMEHASVAAFARFSLQLLSLGAPAELVEQATRAQADETRHAKIGFQLASHYGGRAVGPGPLDLSGALDELTFEEILLTTVREACIGETRASLEVALAAEAAEFPALRQLLGEIAQDEARHAELGWRVAAWMLSQRPDLAGLVQAEVQRTVQQTLGDSPERTEDESLGSLAAHGLLAERALGEYRARADREVILPCAQSLLAQAGA